MVAPTEQENSLLPEMDALHPWLRTERKLAGCALEVTSLLKH